MGQEVQGRDDDRIAAVAARFEAAYLDTQYSYVQFLTEHLADCASAFGGDLTEVLVMAVLGQQRLKWAREAGMGTPADPARVGMTALRIADVSGIPRETVRRRLAVLQGRGWVSRHPRHGWFITGETGLSPARLALQDLEARSLRRLARLYVQLADVAGRTGPVG